MKFIPCYFPTGNNRLIQKNGFLLVMKIFGLNDTVLIIRFNLMEAFQ